MSESTTFNPPTPTPTPSTVAVTVRSDPEGRSIIVDAALYSATHVFQWELGSSHALSVKSPQDVDRVNRYRWTAWSDGGGAGHSVTVTGPTDYTAHFISQYPLMVCCSDYHGTIRPPSNFFDAGQSVQIQAGANPGVSFLSWMGFGNGSYSGPANPVTIVINNPIQEYAGWEGAPTSTPTSTPTATPTGTPTPTPTPPRCVQTFSYDSAAVWIPDNDAAGVDIPISVPISGPLTNIKVDFPAGDFTQDPFSTSVPLNHSYVGDLRIKLISPSGTSVTIFDRPGVPASQYGCPSNNLVFMELADEALSPVESQCPGLNSLEPFWGYYKPNSPLSTFIGESVTGTWTVNIADLAPGDTGAVRKVYLYIDNGCVTTTPTATNTPTATPTNTPTASPTNTPTATPSNTPTADPSPTPPFPYCRGIIDSTFSANFDNVTPPALPQAWTTNSGVDPDGIPWQTSSSGLPSPPAFSPPNAAWVNAPGLRSDKYLFSPGFGFFEDSWAQLRFTQNFDFESGFDGGVLEMSDPHLNGGAYIDITDPRIGGSFVSGGYNSTISSTTDSPIAGRRAWSGNSGGFVTTIVNVPTGLQLYGGFSLRWRSATDTGGSGGGWRVDNANLYDCYTGGYSPTPTNTPTATPTLPPTPTPGPPIAIGTNPEGLSYIVDGITYNSTRYFGWDAGSQHYLSTTSPQNVGSDTRYLWSGWSDGGAQSHIVTFMGQPHIYANFTTQYYLRMQGGSVPVTPPSGFFDAGQSIQIMAVNTPNCFFALWGGFGNGSYTGPANPALVVMNGPIMENAASECSSPTPTPTSTPTATPTSTPVRKAAFDYDGDGKTDISVFRPSSGAWYMQRSRDGAFGMLFGTMGDRIVPADFDGDGKTDIAVYRPSTGIWYILNSSDSTVTYYRFGIPEDLPTPADYDGDGKADISVFRPSTGTWYRQNSSDGSFHAIQFGASEDKPTIGDFDGDGKADIAIFRPSNGTWYRINSSNGALFGEQFGFGSDIVTPADYDGDGKTDLAVFRPSNGYWYVKNSATSTYTAYPFGLSNDIPAPGDFDGDGKADLSVFRPSDGTWYRMDSSNGSFHAFQFGTMGDKPTQTAFRY